MFRRIIENEVVQLSAAMIILSAAYTWALCVVVIVVSWLIGV